MLKQWKHNRSRWPLHGFTLIELLVVIAIIALLVSILLPSLNRAKDLARRVACSAQQRGIILADTVYSNDYDGVYPQSKFIATIDGWGACLWNYTLTQTQTSGPGFLHGNGILFGSEYVSDANIFFCPATPDLVAYGWEAKDKYINYLNNLKSNPSAISGSIKVRAMFVLRTTWDYASIDSDGNFEQIDFNEHSSPQTVILADMVRSSIPLSHSDGANVGYFDGHVNYFEGLPDDYLGYESSIHPEGKFDNDDDPVNLLFYADDHP